MSVSGADDNILVRKNSEETNKERGREIKAIKKIIKLMSVKIRSIIPQLSYYHIAYPYVDT